jgi:hypothetical protein
MIQVLNDLDQQHGGIEPYLVGAEVSEIDITRLRDRLIAPPRAETNFHAAIASQP